MKYISLFIRSVSAFTALLLLLCGCASVDTGEADLAAEAMAPAAEELPLPKEFTNEDKVTELTTTMLRHPPTLHPIFVTDEDTLNIISLICDPAIKLDYSDKPSASVIESWTFDEVGTTVIFNVRKGVKFHGGNTEVKAEDIAYCLDLIIAASPEECIYSKYKSFVSSYEVLDEYKLQMNLTMRTGEIYYLMNFPVIPKSIYSSRGSTTGEIPVGTGPYRVTTYTLEGGMEMEVNDNWWRTAPGITKITAVPIDDNESKLAGYQLGTFNFVAMTSMTANSYRSQKNTTSYKTTTQYYDALVPNMSNRYLSDKSIRQAISLAIDRREIISTGVLGGGLATVSPLRSDLWFLQGTASSLIEYNTTVANSLLEDAGYYLSSQNGLRYQENADGSKGYIDIEIIYCESEELYYRNAVASLIQSDLADIGIRITVKELEKAEFVSAMEAGNFDLALASFLTTYDNDLSYLFGLNASCNYGGYANEQISALAASSMVALTEAEQSETYTALNSLLSDELPHIGLYFRQHIVYASSSIGNIKNLRQGAVFADINSWE